MEIYRHQDHNGSELKVTEEPGSLLRFSNRDVDGTAWTYTTPLQISKLHSALGVWLSENGITAERTPEPATHVDERVTAEDVRRIVADELTKREALWGGYAHEAARQEIRNFLTRAIEMGVDQ